MKFKIYTLLFAILCVSLSSCSKDEDEQELNPVQNTEEKDTQSKNEESVRYYVKYEVTYTTFHINASRIVKFATENGIQTISLDKQSKTVSWEGTYGPVDKNFTASLDCTTPNYSYSSTIHAKINVCREKEPFVIKAENEGSHSLSLSYKIDF